jgi:2-hydroxy-3-keto-5-methylthiopentenyl-1-phosphate phosphatase
MSDAWKLNSPQTLLVLDWDGTVAAHDTLSLIAPSPEALKPYTEAYMADYKTLSDELGERNSLGKMFEWLDAMEGASCQP